MSKSRKISKEEKLAIVKRCLSGELGVCEAGRQIGVNQQSVREWINRYEAEGEEGLTAAQGWRRYPKELKEAAVRDYLAGKGSMEEICKNIKFVQLMLFKTGLGCYCTQGVSECHSRPL